MFGLDLSFVDATDYQDLPESDLIDAAKCWTRPIVGKDVGCFYSHKLAWEAVSESDQLCMIVEDDIVFSSAVTKAIDLIEAHHTDPNSVYDLEFAPRKHLIAQDTLWRDSGLTARLLYINKCGAGCYVLSPEAAKRLLSEVGSYAMVDSWLWTRPWVRKIQVEPCPAAQIRDLTEEPEFSAATSETFPKEYHPDSWIRRKMIRLKLTRDQAASAIAGLILGEKRNLVIDKEQFDISR